MSVTSDPHLKSTRAPSSEDWQQRHYVVDAIEPADSGRVARAQRGWRIRGSVVASVAVLFAATRLLPVLASPLTTATAVDAPAWMVELTSAGTRPVTALIYGDEVGLQLVRVPAASEGQSAARLIPARLAKGELHIIALDLSTLRAQAHAPKGAPPMSWTASGRFITAFQSKTGTGVRVGW